MLALLASHVEEMCAHAREAEPAECCGLIGSVVVGRSSSVYRLRNVASNPLTAYEVAPEELFAAQRAMRERGEHLLGIYHSHPRSDEPTPSESDVRLAYYPDAIYFIIGLQGAEPRVRSFKISDRGGSWERIDFRIGIE